MCIFFGGISYVPHKYRECSNLRSNQVDSTTENSVVIVAIAVDVLAV